MSKCAFCDNEHGMIGDVVCPVKPLPIGLVYEKHNAAFFSLQISAPNPQSTETFKFIQPAKIEDREYIVQSLKNAWWHGFKKKNGETPNWVKKNNSYICKHDAAEQ